MTTPMWLWEGVDKGKCFPPHSCSGGNSSCTHCPTLKKKCWSSRSMLQSTPRKVPLDDTWAEVSSFRGNVERTGKGWRAPLNTAGEAEQSILQLQVRRGNRGPTTPKRILHYQSYGFKANQMQRACLDHCLKKKSLLLFHFQWTDDERWKRFRKKKHFRFHLRLQFLIISMTMKGENKQTLISLRTFCPRDLEWAGLDRSTPLLIFVNCRLLHTDVPQLDFSSLSLCLLWQTCG